MTDFSMKTREGLTNRIANITATIARCEERLARGDTGGTVGSHIVAGRWQNTTRVDSALNVARRALATSEAALKAMAAA